MASAPEPSTVPDAARRWTDRRLSLDERVEALLTAMTPAEKVAQLGSIWPGFGFEGSGAVAPMQEVFSASARDFDDAVKHGIGHLTRIFGTAPVTAEQGRARAVDLQRRVVAGGRLGIPAIAHEECLTGFTTLHATVYPTSLAWAATFDPGLIERMAGAIGSDMRAVGVHQGLSPVLDVVRDYRWGRVEETMGEDPYLVGVLGTAYVRGLEQAGRHRHPQALRRLLRVPGRPQPRAGVDGPPRAARGASCRRSRWRSARVARGRS